MSQRILVVDDEPSIQEVLRDALTAAGFIVDTSPDAADALELVREQLFDAAIIDFALPDMTGVMLHHRIRQMDPELAQRTVFVSGHSQSTEDLDYFGSAAAGFLAKPFDVRDVVAAVRQTLADPGQD